MGLAAHNIGKYKLGRTIGEGTFAKVKLGVDSTNGQYVAIKIIDKHMVLESNLKYQVQREIRTMKLLHHPNIVRIHEVIGSKTKIYIVMEHVSGGQLTDKMSYVKKLEEWEARKLFQQLIDAVDYCHNKGVCHRDLKPENLLMDHKGNLKVSDFGLSALQKPGGILTTACGSPCYVAPELLLNKGYNGAAADVWSCGVILFEVLAGRLPFDDRNLINLYKKISRAEYTFPLWFTKGQKKLLYRIFDPNPRTRITIPEIIEDEWFQKDYVPACGYEIDDKIHLDDVNAAFDSIEEIATETKIPKSSSFINAFQLIAMSQDLDLSGLFEEQDENKQKKMLGSKHTIDETIKKIEAAAMDASLSVERMNNSKMKMHTKQKMTRCCRSCLDISAEVIEVAPTNCVIEISKSAGELKVYKEFCKSLSSLLIEKSELPSQTEEPEEANVDTKNIQDIGSSEEKNYKENKDP
ncbi:CBL-interacting serine/threonine-protein kinase 21 isoform X1 [Quercus suber]|uniref:CBL-interacting serine/threonine-protein kinase 21 isoform X1 n=1 Tax=Quercus suber TaxID=58331 RepID=UPI000CE27036|nr:CBL-interacting serine/threonine-protein kinase 21 [Quercus suber]POF11955.1 cbl-interacting serine/threonine-protein kinase 21 [Quercus suber]